MIQRIAWHNYDLWYRHRRTRTHYYDNTERHDRTLCGRPITAHTGEEAPTHDLVGGRIDVTENNAHYRDCIQCRAVLQKRLREGE